MKLRKDIDIVLFLKEARKCSEDVFLETEEGDRLNLKSVLSQYIFAAIAENREISEESRIICSEDDVKILEKYLVFSPELKK